MQIHEPTLRRKTNEGLMDTIKGVGQKAAKAFNDPSSLGLTSNAKFASNQAAARLEKATQGFVAKIAAEWPAVAQTITSKDALNKVRPVQTTTEPEASAAPAEPGRKVSRTRGGQMSSQLAKSKTGQQMQKMFGAPKGGIEDMKSDLEEAFSDLPGAKPKAGGPVDPRVTKGVGRQGNPLTSAYITKFKDWVDSKVSTRETNTGQTLNLSTVQSNPDIARSLNTMLASIYNTRNDPNANQKAVTAYLTKVVDSIQQQAAELRRDNPKSAARANTKSVPGQMDSGTAKMARAMNLSQDNLNKMKQVISAAGEKVTSGTGAPTIDNLLVAAGLLK